MLTRRFKIPRPFTPSPDKSGRGSCRRATRKRRGKPLRCFMSPLRGLHAHELSIKFIYNNKQEYITKMNRYFFISTNIFKYCSNILFDNLTIYYFANTE